MHGGPVVKFYVDGAWLIRLDDVRAVSRNYVYFRDHGGARALPEKTLRGLKDALLRQGNREDQELADLWEKLTAAEQRNLDLRELLTLAEDQVAQVRRELEAERAKNAAQGVSILGVSGGELSPSEAGQ